MSVKNAPIPPGSDHVHCASVDVWKAVAGCRAEEYAEQPWIAPDGNRFNGQTNFTGYES